MFSIPSSVRVFAYAEPTDMRKSFDGLAAIVTNAFSKDPFNGDYFVFFNRSLDRCKILLWDRLRRLVETSGAWPIPTSTRCDQRSVRRNRHNDIKHDSRWRRPEDRPTTPTLSTSS